eukprot:Skav213254  [mRNA]  locus=scaffold1311:39874:44557:+ [translate_table: standard]
MPVPGMSAPVSDVNTLWNSMMRWVSSKPSPFASFLKSLPRLSPSSKEGTAPALWPIPPPYPQQWLPEDEAGKVPFSVRARQRAVNLCVMALNWLHMKKPKHAPQEIALGAPLKRGQGAIVQRLEKFFEEISWDGPVGPKEMGRTAANTSAFFGLGHARSSGAVHESKHVGEVVGRLKTQLPLEAKPLQAERLSLPKDPPLFDPAKFLKEPYHQIYVDPASRAVELDESVQLPRVRVHGTAEQNWAFVKFLDSHHRLYLASEKKVRPNLLCGAFALGKDATSDRLIVDARLPNAAEPTESEWVKTLGSVQALLQLEVASHDCLRFSGTDLKDYYYSYKVSSARSRRNALRLPLQPAQVQHLMAYRSELDEDRVVYPCLRTMAMGDNNAVELGQLCHIQLGLQSNSFTPSELLCIHGRAPRGPMAAGIIIDDVLLAEQLSWEEASAAEEGNLLTEGAKRLSGLCEEYLDKGLNPHPKKTFRDAKETDIWGAHLNGDSGIVRPSARRLVPLLHVTVQVARLGLCSVAMLEVLCGAWISILQFRRRMMCLLDICYAMQVGRERDELIQLPGAALAELWVLIALAPLAATNVRAESMTDIFLTDASEEVVAGVRASVGFCFAKELQRHCLLRGAWSRLLSPWQSWLKRYGKLQPEEELPDGVPLVCHPLWTAVIKVLQFKLRYEFQVKKRRHINLLELQGVLEVERRLSATRQDVRYLLGADSQVALAALTKGRSSSPHLNGMLQESLASLLGAGLYGNYGYVPSLANCADDPTRDRPIRAPAADIPEWLQHALQGRFELMDSWLASLGFSPIQVAGLPCSDDPSVISPQAQQAMLAGLRDVAKPERLKNFDASQREQKMKSREHQEPEGQTKIDDKTPSRSKETAEGAENHFVASKEVAPPLSKHAHTHIHTHVHAEPERTSSKAIFENSLAPEISADARALLQSLEPSQVILPGGVRAQSAADLAGLHRAGFLDLYSGKAGVAMEISKKFQVWVVTFDFERGPHQDLLCKKVQQKVFSVIEAHMFLGVGAAPECASFSRAVWPVVRDAQHPQGLQDISANMRIKVDRGNQHAAFCAVVLARADALGMGYWLENPDGSFIWLQPEYLRRGIGRPEHSYRFDMCRYRTRWRKRTRIATNTFLQGQRCLCQGNRSHQRLRGRSAAHKCSWTRLAQVYPRQLCVELAAAMGAHAGLADPSKLRFSVAACAKCGHDRIGEAANPGPRQRSEVRRDASELLNAPLVEDTTLHLQDRVWERFRRWLHSHLSENTCRELFVCPALAACVVERYGVHLFRTGAGLYELRHLLVLIQQQRPEVRIHLAGSWQLVNKWEQVRPLVHRTPLPEVLYKAMVAVAACWGWTRWVVALVVGFQGITRIGEALSACRCDLVLPCDNFDDELKIAFLQIRKPKTRRRGKGRVQHARIEQAAEVRYLEQHLAKLDAAVKLFPLSASAFRARWDRVMEHFKIPVPKRPTPASVRGGGAIAAYRRGKPIQDLLWAMRISSQPTLESYLQELAADNFLFKLPEDSKRRIKQSAAMYHSVIAQ